VTRTPLRTGVEAAAAPDANSIQLYLRESPTFLVYTAEAAVPLTAGWTSQIIYLR
jgi:hypothetical protein